MNDSATAQRLVLFCGAGFSAPLGLPVMNEFYRAVDASQVLQQHEKDLVGELLLEARSANSFLESSPTNLEDMLSFALMAHRIGAKSAMQSDDRFEQLKRVLRTVYSTYASPQSTLGALGSIKNLLPRGIVEERRIACITTNYDLNLECALSLMYGTPGNIGFGYTPVGGNPPRRLYSTEGVPLLKLHGSVNWYRSPESKLLVDDHLTSWRTRNGETFLAPRAWDRKWDVEASSPVIVPPSFLKSDLLPELKAVWSMASQRLAEAHVVAFVGYSFPASDTEMLYFLASALRQNHHLRRVWVVDPNAEQIVARLCSGVSRIGSHFKELLRPIPIRWQEAHPELLMS